MGSLIDLTGKRFGRLTVIGRSKASSNKRVFWDCVCDCGKFHSVDGWNLRNGNVQSCGCLHKSIVTKHGDYLTNLYRVWRSMKGRCSNPNCSGFRFYGGKGISVCDEWLEYPAFKKWAFESGYKKGLTIDRIDSGGDYCPENCRWITQMENAKRTARNMLTVDGVTKSYIDWEESIGMGKMSIEHWVERHGEEYAIRRIDATLHPENYTKEEIAGLGIHKNRRKYISINGETLSLSAWANKIGVSHQTVLRWEKNYGNDYVVQKIMEYLEAGRD